MSVIKTNLGAVTAYADARKHGYTGTREQFGEDQAKVAENATKVAKDRAAVEQLTDQTTALTKLAAESEISAGLARNAAQDAQKKAEDAANEVLNQLASKEDLSNKVSTITSENSDNEHYPSTKAVYEAMQEITVPAGRINAVTVNGIEQTIRDKTVEILVSKETVGLLNVDNTADISKPISTATQTALNTKLSKSDVVSVDATAVTGQAADAKSVYTEMQKMITGSGMIDTVTLNGVKQTIEGKTVNILVDKSTVGLSHADDTSDADKPVSTAQSAAIADAKAAGTGAKALIDSHAENKENPHGVTKAQIGLGNVDNTADKDKPISDKVQTALDGKLAESDVVVVDENAIAGQAADAKSVYDELQNVIASAGKIDAIAINGTEQTIVNKTVDIVVDKSTVGLGNIDNTSDADKPVSNATQTALDAKLAKADVVAVNLDAVEGKAADAKSVYDEIQKVVTGSGMIDTVLLNGVSQTITGKTVNISADKTTVGLSEVDNTSDEDKPVSTAQATAIAEAKKAGTDAQTAINTVKSAIDTHTADTKNPHSVTKAQIGLGDVDNTSDADKPISALTRAALNTKLAKSDVVAIGADVVTGKAADAKSVYDEIQSAVAGAGKIDAITVNDAEQTIEGKTAKIAISKSTVGLGNVDNTADTDKPVSAVQATAIADAKKAGTDAQSTVDTHIADKANPHEVTKAQVGLGNVDNTSDTDKPISTAAQTAIDAKLAKSDVVDISASATAGQAADAKSTFNAFNGLKETAVHAATVADKAAEDITAMQTALSAKLDESDVVSVTASAVTGQAADAKSVYDEIQNAVAGMGFIVTVTRDSSGTISADKTFAEITAALNNGASVIVKIGGAYADSYLFRPCSQSSSFLEFESISDYDDQTVLILYLGCSSIDKWQILSSVAESTNRMTQTISDSPSAAKYTSEKAVADYVSENLPTVRTWTAADVEDAT